MEPCESKLRTLTRAPITPRLVRRKYSNGLVRLEVFRNGYKNSGTWAATAKRSNNQYLIIINEISEKVEAFPVYKREANENPKGIH